MNGLRTELAELVALPGGVGLEDPVAEWITAKLGELSLVPERDLLGNVVLPPPRPRILVTAHMDQVGYMVSRLCSDHADCLSVGDPEARTTRPFAVRVVGASHDPIDGEFEADDESGCGVLRCNGLRDVRVGDRVTFANHLECLGADRVRGPALDNRVGCLILLHVVRSLSTRGALAADQVAFAWTVREETDQAGALRVARTSDPDCMIAVDTTYAGASDDGPGSPIRVGHGPAITLLDEGMVCHPPLIEVFNTVAERLGISWQREVVEDGSSEAGRVQGELGIPAMALLVPVEHPHTSVEVADLTDIVSTVDLLLGGLDDALARLF